MKYLITTTEVYRFSSENEATNFIEEAKKEPGYVLTKHTVEYKEIKRKGEVEDYYWKTTLVKSFNNIKEPTTDIDIIYERGSAF